MVEGRILACKWVKLACQRHLDDLAKSKSKEYPYTFDSELASLPCEFIECMPHTEGEWATPRGKRSNLIKLEPWQIFSICVIWGWVRKSNRRRRFREAYIKIPRKNGKSILASVLALYMLVMDGENAPQVYSGATTERQAMEVFKPAYRILETTQTGRDLKAEFGLEAHAKRILSRYNGGSFVVLVRRPGDGAGASFAVIDERHEHKTDELHDTMKQGQRARLQPLLFNITTAGYLIDGPCHQFEQFCERILAGDVDSDATFAIMYGIDEGDDWRTEEAARKANPNWGVSVYPDTVLQELQDAIQNPALQNAYRTKTLNEWMNVGSGLFNMAAWAECHDKEMKIEDFAGEVVDEGDDLAGKIDLASRCKVFTRMLPNPTSGLMERHYFVFGRHYAPKARVHDGDHPHYEKWERDGWLTTHAGWEIQLPWIQQDIEEDLPKYQYRSLAFDPWNALQMQQLLAGKVPEDVVQDAPQKTEFLSGATKEVQAAMLAKRIHHNGDPVLTFCMSCVVGEEDNRRNIFPKRVKNGRNKIDAAMAMINGIGRAMTLEPPKVSVYSRRGILTI